MPIVFVHGVNNRDDDDYRDNVAARDGFLKEIVSPALGVEPSTVNIRSPYWGGAGATFRWNMAVLPDASEDYESFGAQEKSEAFGRAVELVEKIGVQGTLVAKAKEDFEAAVELLYGATIAGVVDEEEARAIAQSYLKASKYAVDQPQPSWLDEVEDDNFPDLLNHHAEASDVESFGAGGILDQLKEGLSRLSSAIPAAGSALAGRLARKKLNATVTRFAGDAFVYLAERGTPEAPGKIVKIVLDGLRAAEAAKTPDDSKLVVIAHSFGGEIMYDILTHFAPALEVDCMITVGSQVGLFEEMKLYGASDKKIPDLAGATKVRRPANLRRWLNVFDTNDVLSFRMGPVFEGVQDFHYDTGYSSFQAHGGYFLRPSFYTRLASRLTQ